VDKAAADKRNCMLMSDSLAVALEVDEIQREEIRKSDMICLKACEKAGYRSTGAMDTTAMREHASQMREILTKPQFERWNSLCGDRW
jgi:hypothetical protein